MTCKLAASTPANGLLPFLAYLCEKADTTVERWEKREKDGRKKDGRKWEYAGENSAVGSSLPAYTEHSEALPQVTYNPGNCGQMGPKLVPSVPMINDV